MPPVKDQDQEVGELVDRSVKFTLPPAMIEVELAVKSATGGWGVPPPPMASLGRLLPRDVIIDGIGTPRLGQVAEWCRAPTRLSV